MMMSLHFLPFVVGMVVPGFPGIGTSLKSLLDLLHLPQYSFVLFEFALDLTFDIGFFFGFG